MILRFGPVGKRTIQKYTRCPHLAWQQTSPQRWDMTMPAAWWADTSSRLRDVAFNSQGQGSAKLPERRAVHAIELGLVRLLTLPALKQESVRGHSYDMIPAWDYHGRFNPFYAAVPGVEPESMVILTPQVERRRLALQGQSDVFSMTVTSWVPRPPGVAPQAWPFGVFAHWEDHLLPGVSMTGAGEE